VEWSTLPKVRVRVEVNTQEAIKDKLMGQNAMQAFSDPNIQQSPYFEDILGALGFPPSRIQEMMQKKGLQQELVPQGAGPAGAPPPEAAPMMPGGM
jgi:hypothetical protein